MKQQMTLFTLYTYIFYILVYIEIEPMKSFKIQLFECTYACRAYWNRFKLLTKRSSFDKIVCVRLCVCELSIIGNRYLATSNRCVVVLYDMCLLCICYPFSCVHAVYIENIRVWVCFALVFVGWARKIYPLYTYTNEYTQKAPICFLNILYIILVQQTSV